MCQDYARESLPPLDIARLCAFFVIYRSYSALCSTYVRAHNIGRNLVVSWHVFTESVQSTVIVFNSCFLIFRLDIEGNNVSFAMDYPPPILIFLFDCTCEIVLAIPDTDYFPESDPDMDGMV